MFLQADRVKDAVSALAAAGDWAKAKRVVQELAPELEIYLDDLYKEAMIREGQVESLAKVDADAALEILVKQGQWAQVFETAKNQGGPSMLHKYVSQRAAQLLKIDNVAEALHLYVEQGAPAIGQNYNLYMHLSERVLNSSETSSEYAHLAKLRNLLFGLVRSVDDTSVSYY